MGEQEEDRVSLLLQLASLPRHPESVPINMLVQVEGTPLHGVEKLDALDFVRTIAVARILMPGSWVRLSAGRTDMSDELQTLCVLAGTNSIFYGEQLLTTPNADEDADRQLLRDAGLHPAPPRAQASAGRVAASSIDRGAADLLQEQNRVPEGGDGGVVTLPEGFSAHRVELVVKASGKKAPGKVEAVFDWPAEAG